MYTLENQIEDTVAFFGYFYFLFIYLHVHIFSINRTLFSPFLNLATPTERWGVDFQSN
jgi:hypothetical protein